MTLHPSCLLTYRKPKVAFHCRTVWAVFKMWVAILCPRARIVHFPTYCVSVGTSCLGVPLGAPGSPLQSNTQLNLSVFHQQKLGQQNYIIAPLCNDYFHYRLHCTYCIITAATRVWTLVHVRLNVFKCFDRDFHALHIIIYIHHNGMQ